ncbi:MAG: hypothetical protein ACRCT8_04210 [Lacipirellulaceae bacterium]
MVEGEHVARLSFTAGEKTVRFERTLAAKPSGKPGIVGVDPKDPWNFRYRGNQREYFWNSTTTYYLMGIIDEAEIAATLDRLGRLGVNRVRSTLCGRTESGMRWNEGKSAAIRNLLPRRLTRVALARSPTPPKALPSRPGRYRDGAIPLVSPPSPLSLRHPPISFSDASAASWISVATRRRHLPATRALAGELSLSVLPPAAPSLVLSSTQWRSSTSSAG